MRRVKRKPLRGFATGIATRTTNAIRNTTYCQRRFPGISVRVGLHSFQALADVLAEPAHGALRAAELLADLGRGVALEAQFEDGPLVRVVDRAEQRLHRLRERRGLVRLRLAVE